jgi:hypothetical protein
LLKGEERVAEGEYYTKEEFFEWLDQEDEKVS